MFGFLQNPLFPKYKPYFISYCYSFAQWFICTHWHVFWSMNYKFKNITFLSETKYTWIVHIIWLIIYLSTLCDIKFKILVTIYSIQCYFISNIWSTNILIRFQYEMTYQDLFIIHHVQVPEPSPRFYEVLCHSALSKHLPHYQWPFW